MPAIIPRFFVPTPLSLDCAVQLSGDVQRHARVLRMRHGDAMTLFNGQGGEWRAVLQDAGKVGLIAHVQQAVVRECELPYRVTLAQGIAGSDKMDWLVEKAVELGVTAVQPLLTQKSVVRLDGDRAARRVAHWQAMAQAACEQCGRNLVPTIAPILPIRAWLATDPLANSVGLLLSPHADVALTSAKPVNAVTLLIGPEGGLSAEEELAALQTGFSAVGLGPRILRCETAGLAALAALNALWNGF